MNGTQARTTTIMHLVRATDFQADGTLRTICGETLRFDPRSTETATRSGDFVVCPLCELADELGEA